jgi:Methyltransferase domain
MGTHAQLIAKHARSYVGIDLTEYAVAATRRRLEIAGLPGTVLQMDAEKMEFADRRFDLIWTWGVIHHSSSTERILTEMRRGPAARRTGYRHGLLPRMVALLRLRLLDSRPAPWRSVQARRLWHGGAGEQRRGTLTLLFRAVLARARQPIFHGRFDRYQRQQSRDARLLVGEPPGNLETSLGRPTTLSTRSPLSVTRVLVA